MASDLSDRIYMEDGDRVVCTSESCSPGKLKCCTEMLHYDEYRQTNKVADGVPPLFPYFATKEAAPNLVLFKTVLNSATDTYGAVTVVYNEADASKPYQPFCSEMQHYDDCSPPADAKALTMRERFYQKTKTYLWAPSGDKNKLEVYAVDSVAGEKYSSEMQHWDDYRSSKGEQYSDSMIKAFRV